MAVDPHSPPQPTAETNEYLALREAKIARNEQRLRDLGLLRHVVVHQGTPSSSSNGPSAAPVAAKIVSRTHAARKHQASPPLRRSARLELRPQEHQTSPVDNGKRRKRNEIAPAKSDGERNSKVMTVQQIAATLCNNDATAAPKNKDSLTPSNSARSIWLDVQQLITKCLGVQLSSTGKAFVMQTSVQLAASDAAVTSAPSTSISFNKYSGIQEWANNVVFLWVNLHAPQNEVRNDFTHQGRQVTFYGGSRMHDQTPVIQKVKRLGVRAAAAANELDSADGIVLWCRSYETHRKAFGPYVCLGRLAVSFMVVTVKPVIRKRDSVLTGTLVCLSLHKSSAGILRSNLSAVDVCFSVAGLRYFSGRFTNPCWFCQSHGVALVKFVLLPVHYSRYVCVRHNTLRRSTKVRQWVTGPLRNSSK